MFFITCLLTRLSFKNHFKHHKHVLQTLTELILHPNDFIAKSIRSSFFCFIKINTYLTVIIIMYLLTGLVRTEHDSKDEANKTIFTKLLRRHIKALFLPTLYEANVYNI